MRLLQAVRPWSQSCWPSTSALRTCKRRAIRIKIQWSRCILRLSRNDAALVMSCPVVSYRGLLSWCLNIEYGGKSGARGWWWQHRFAGTAIFSPKHCPHWRVVTARVKAFGPKHFACKFSRKSGFVWCPCAFPLRRLAQSLRCGVVLILERGIFPVNSRIKLLLWHVHVHFNCTYKSCG